ncbi:MAG: hypothetical protein RSF42_10950 [Comamonas sp.]
MKIETEVNDSKCSEADIVLAAVSSGDWTLSRAMSQEYLTERANKEHAWSIQRGAAPYCTGSGDRIWFGPTALIALQRAAGAFGFELPKPTPPDPTSYQVTAVTTAYEQGVGKGHDAYRRGVEIENPYGPGYRCDKAWQLGYLEGLRQAKNAAAVAPPASQSDLDAKRWQYAMDWNTVEFAVCRRVGNTGTCWEPIKNSGPIDHAMSKETCESK